MWRPVCRPAVAAACVWGRRDAVMTLMQRIGALGGDWTACGELPGMLGPVPIAQPDTVDARELEATADRVKAVIRVPRVGEPSWRPDCTGKPLVMWRPANPASFASE